MNNSKILKNYLLYFSLFLLICIVGISGVFAYTYEDIGFFNNQTDVKVEVAYNNSPLTLTLGHEYYLEQVYSLDINVSNINWSSNYVYQFELFTPGTILTRANSATVMWFGANNTSGSCNVLTTKFDNEYPQLTFKCDSAVNINELYIRYYNSSNQYLFDSSYFKWVYSYARRRVPSETDNTGEIKDSIQQNAQDIINNQNQNTQDIIDNNNENTDRIIEDNKKNFQTCRPSINLLNYKNYFNIGSSGTIITEIDNGLHYKVTSGYGFGYSISLSPSTYTLSFNLDNIVGNSYNKYIRITFIDDNFQNYSFNIINNVRLTFTNTTTIKALRFYIQSRDSFEADITNIQIEENNHFTNYESYGEEICVNKLDQQTNAINGLNDSLTDDSSVDMSSLGDTLGWLPAGPIDSILNLPINMLNGLNTALNGTCQSLNVNVPYINTNVSIPCVSTIFSNITGLSNFWNWVGAIASVVILYRYLLSLWNYYDRLTTMQVNFRDDFGGGV